MQKFRVKFQLPENKIIQEKRPLATYKYYIQKRTFDKTSFSSEKSKTEGEVDLPANLTFYSYHIRSEFACSVW